MVKLVFFGQFVLLGIAFFGIGLHYTYFRRMRLRYPAIWESLRRPSVFNGGWSLMTSFPVVRFLWRKEYQRVGDEEFSHLSRLVAAYNLLFLCLFVVFVALLLIRA